MDRYHHFNKQVVSRRIILTVFLLAGYTFLPLPTFASFHSSLYRYKQEIITPGTTDLSTTTDAAGIRLNYDIASYTLTGGLRLADDTNEKVDYVIAEQPQSSEWLPTTIIERYRTPEKDVMVVDLGEESRHDMVNVSINEEVANGTVSIFSTATYMGIDMSMWDVLLRDGTIFKNVKTDKGIFTDTSIEYTPSEHRYLMVVVRRGAGEMITMGRVSKENPTYAESREQFYADATIDETDNKTIITIDTKTNFVEHDRIDATMYNESFLTTALIETSTDNNQWTKRGSDSLYHFTYLTTPLNKNWISYEKNNDRFIRITMPQTKLLMHRLALVSGPTQYLVFDHHQNRRYTLYYGNPYDVSGIGATNQISTSTSATTTIKNFFSNGKELKMGIREDNPNFINYSSVAASHQTFNINSFALYLWNDYPYTQSILTIFFSLITIYSVAQILKMKS